MHSYPLHEIVFNSKINAACNYSTYTVRLFYLRVYNYLPIENWAICYSLSFYDHESDLVVKKTYFKPTILNQQTELFAVTPLPWCKHLSTGVNPLPPDGIDVDVCCEVCSVKQEPWVCLTCYHVSCRQQLNMCNVTYTVIYSIWGTTFVHVSVLIMLVLRTLIAL